MIDMNIDLRLGDCLEVLKTLPDNSVDSVVVDPPYHLTSIVKRFGKEGSAPAQFGTDGAYSRASKGFMGKEWDGGDIAFRTDVWSECLRVLKPGGHLLSFSHSRTYHRMAVAIEDAGFEIRDSIMWIYGSGFPKSHNIGKAIDKRGGNNHLTQEIGEKLKSARESRKITKTQADEMFCNGTTNYMWFEGRTDGIRLPDDESFTKICNQWEELKPYQDLIKSANREIIGQYDGDMGGLGGERLGQPNGDITIAATESAKIWEGWGTALKPAHEPICMARKPLSEKSIAENVLKWGTGGINIDGCRIEGEVRTTPIHSDDVKDDTTLFGLHKTIQHERVETTEGRFPANIMFDDDTDEDWKRYFYCPKTSKKERNAGLDGFEKKTSAWMSPDSRTDKENYDRTSPGFERWKPQPRANNHPTVKPIKLMEYLITLVTPKGGVVMDCFMGSGSTGIAARNLGFRFIGIEREQEYFDIAKQRIGQSVQTKLDL
jgi:DNA modification methylase